MAALTLLSRISLILIIITAYISTQHWAIIVNWNLVQVGSVRVELPFLLDVFRCAFIASVLVITSAVLVFSGSYMREEKHFLRFHLLVGAFVLSMLFLITSPNLVRILLGWDGLGVTSYLLVIYFQRAKSFNAGLLTALTNRIGDVLILIAIATTVTLGGWNFFVWAHAPSAWGRQEVCVCLLLVAASTKRAQIPFSAWLPAAIAAPTPVSSLVHSSTLVTAGVYLLFRFGELLACSNNLIYLISVGILTIIIAGATALKELDIKKIIALSTLSQLGLMITTLGLGLYEVAYFHLLTHAFFKALLFMSVGNIIHLSRDFQDLRKISLMEFCFPVSLSFSLVANCRLCGFPFLAGFYSKDLILELIIVSSASFLVFFLIFAAVALTVIYSVRFIFLVICGGLSSRTCLSGQDNDWAINLSIAILWPLAIRAGSRLTWTLFSSPVLAFLPIELKNVAFVVILSAAGVGGLCWGGTNRLKTNQNAWSWGAMWALPFISSVYVNWFFLAVAALARKLDLAWVISFSWAPILGVIRVRSSDKRNHRPTIFRVLSLAAWLTFSIRLIYLRI